MPVSPRTFACGVIFAAALSASACGGGGSGGSGGDGGGGSPPAAPTWTPNVYADAGTFENKCVSVRTGVDSQGTPFPDQPGTQMHEKMFLRSWTNKTYLWNTDIPDSNPANIGDTISYFLTLKTAGIMPNGRPKDNFHFYMSTAEYLAQATSAATAGYGAEIRIYQGTVPRDVRILYTQAGTPAAELLSGTPKLARGVRLLTVDGVDLVNANTSAAVDTLNNGTFPRTAGETHTFTVRNVDGSQRSFALVSANIVEAPVNRSSVLTTPSGKVGYVLFNTFSPFSSEAALVNTISSFKAQGVNDVVLDLRYNGGGLLAVASQLSYMIAGTARTAGKIFEALQFNPAAGASDPVTGGANNPTPFYSTGLGFSVTGGSPIQSLDLPRVYVLSASNTCSASESVINGLRGADVEVILIGSTTCGKPYGFYPESNCGQTYFSIQFKGINNKAFGDYPDGFAPANSSLTIPVKIPGCAVGDDLSHELGDTSEAMLAAALQYRATATCPAPSGNGLSPQRIAGEGPEMESSSRTEGGEFLRHSRNLAGPGRTVSAQ